MAIVRAVLIVEVERQSPTQHPENDEELSRCLADHLVETFNDDGSIVSIRFLAPGDAPEDAEAVSGRWIVWHGRQAKPRPGTPAAFGLHLKPQETPVDDVRSSCRFQKQFVATPGALEEFGSGVILSCLFELQDLARRQEGLQYLQVYEKAKGGATLWFIEDGQAVTALLPSEY